MADKKEKTTKKAEVETKKSTKKAKPESYTMKDAESAQLEYDQYRMALYEGKEKDTSKLTELRKKKARILTQINNGK